MNRFRITNAIRSKNFSSRTHQNNGVSVYIHWPYCKKLCSYCNFNKYVQRSVDQKR